MAEYLIQSETLDDIADAINAKTGGSSAMTPAEMVTEIGSIQTGGGGGFHETGTVSFHTGEVLKTLTIPISAEAEALDRYVFAVRPIKTWALVDGVWVERDTMDFTGINGFQSGTWNPVLAFLFGAKARTFRGRVYRQYGGRGVYSGGQNGNAMGNNVEFTIDNGNLVFSNTNSAAVCVADGGLTFEYHIWGWS